MKQKLPKSVQALLYEYFWKVYRSGLMQEVRLKTVSDRLLLYWGKTRQRGGMPLPASLQGVKESAGKAGGASEQSEPWPCSVDDPLLASSGGHSTRQGRPVTSDGVHRAASASDSSNSQIVKQPFDLEEYVMWYAERGIELP